MAKGLDLFEELDGERKQEKKELKVDINPRLEEMLYGLDGILWYAYFADPSSTNLYYQCGGVIPENPTAKEIEQLALILPDYRFRCKKVRKESIASYSGIYLSALMAHSEDQHFVIPIVRENNYLWRIGFLNQGNSITINGDSGDEAGVLMCSGKIHIAGNAGRNIGYRMRGGEIHIDGDYRSLGPWTIDGNIYHKGKHIVRKGVRFFV